MEDASALEWAGALMNAVDGILLASRRGAEPVRLEPVDEGDDIRHLFVSVECLVRDAQLRSCGSPFSHCGKVAQRTAGYYLPPSLGAGESGKSSGQHHSSPAPH